MVIQMVRRHIQYTRSFFPYRWLHTIGLGRRKQLSRFQPRERRRNRSDGDLTVHQNGNASDIIRQPDIKIAFIHQEPFIQNDGLDLDRWNRSDRGADHLAAENLDLQFPIFFTLMYIDKDRCAGDQVGNRSEIVQRGKAILDLRRNVEFGRSTLGQPLRRMLILIELNHPIPLPYAMLLVQGNLV